MPHGIGRITCILVAALLCGLRLAPAETCTTQSEMAPVDRDRLVTAALMLARDIQADDLDDLRPLVVPEYDKDPAPMANLVAGLAPKLKDATMVVQQVYLLDATGLKPGADGKPSDAEFFCSLNKSPASADFLIPGLPAGRYGFVIVHAASPKAPWSLSFLLRQERNWAMAGFYPKPLTAAGHDGLWYWTQARDSVQHKQMWNAYLLYREAQQLLQPANFISSTNLDKLRKETEAATPPALSEGISANVPLVVKAADGAEYRFTELTLDDSRGGDQPDVAVHLQPEQSDEPEQSGEQASQSMDSGATARPAKHKPAPVSPSVRNSKAMAALLAAYPELRSRFHGVWVFADISGQNPFVSEAAMSEIH